jgi:hypothetical protein
MRLQGHLRDYPLRDLLTIFTNRRETGRLQIDFESVPGIFHFKDGRLINARVGPFEGFSAVNLAFSLSEASFHFDALETAPEVTINDPNERLMLSRLLGFPLADDDDFDSGESIPSRLSPPANTPAEIGRSGANGLPVSDNTNRILLTAKETLIYVHRLALAAGAAAINVANRILRTARETLTYVHRHALAAGVAAILLLLVPAGIAITVGLGRNDGPPGADVTAQASNHSLDKPADSAQSSANQSAQPTLPADDSAHTSQEPTAKLKSSTKKLKVASSAAAPAETSSDQPPTLPKEKAHTKNSSKLIVVVMNIEEGRVSEAYVKDHQPGLEAYEATAIRLARQRRYPKDKMGTETTVVKVTSDQ